MDLVRFFMYFVGYTAEDMGGLMGTTSDVMEVVDTVGQMVQDYVGMWQELQCEEFARANSFVRKLKGLDLDGQRALCRDAVYPESVREAIEEAMGGGFVGRRVNHRNSEDVLAALDDGFCLVLQHKTSGALTSFVGTRNLKVIDARYGLQEFDRFYLNSVLYDCVHKIEKIRPYREQEKKANLYSVMSGALRFREGETRDTKGIMVLSSSYYTVNLDRLFAVYRIDFPAGCIGDMLSSAGGLAGYQFDKEIDDVVCRSLLAGKNLLSDIHDFVAFVPGVSESVDATPAYEKWVRAWNKMHDKRHW